MADKQISQLVAATTINNDDLFVMQQGGTAKKLSGQKLSDFVYQSAADQIERVNEAVEQTQAAVDSLEEQKNEIAQTIASMAELGTDTTLTTPGMAADAAATGEVKDIALARFEQAEITGVPIATFDDGADDVPVKKLVVDIVPVQSGSGDPSPTNIRPITGWTGANVTRTGKNIFSPIAQTQTVYTHNGITYTKNEDGTFLVNGTATDDSFNYILGKPSYANLGLGKFGGKRVRVTGCPNGGSATTYGINIARIDPNSSFANDYGDGAYLTLKSSEEMDASTGSVYIRIKISSGTTVNNLLFKPMICLEGDGDGEFEPYQGTTYSITFPDAAGTVYGGTLDVMNGVLTVDTRSVTLSGSDFINYGTASNGTKYVSTDSIYVHSSPPVEPISNMYLGSTSPVDKTVRLSGNKVIVYDNSFSSLEDAQTLFNSNSLQVVYFVSDTTYQLTPPIVRTILALNNIWADTGNINDLIYRKMPIPAEELENTIESMIAGVEHTMEATQNYTEGDLVIAVHKLYHIDSNIASGETLVPGINCSVTTIEAELASLKTSVNNLDLALISLGNLATLNYQVVT